MQRKFNEQLKDYRIDKRLSQREVAEQLGVATSTYSNWEQGRTQPSIDDLKNIIKILYINPNELFNE